MAPILKALFLTLLLTLCVTCAQAQAPVLRGYDASQSQKYQYVTFGTYFSDGYGHTAPVLWRVLGPGIPAAEDVSTDGTNENDNTTKSANEDVIPPEMADVYCLMTEYIVDFHQYNAVRDTRDGEPLQYKDSELFRFCNDLSLDRDEDGKPVGLLGWLFTQSEREVLVYMPERGYVSPPSRKGELFRRDYGFINEDFRECLRRQATGTYYAFDQGLKYIVDCWSWYWTTDRRRVGFRWIVGDNGHTSVAGADREGGVRLVCYAHTGQLECIGGSGTKEDPYQLMTKTDYMNVLKRNASAASRSETASLLEASAFAVSRAQADAEARIAEAARLAAQAEAERQQRIQTMVSEARLGKAAVRLAAEHIRLSAERALLKAEAQLGQLRGLPAAQDAPASGAMFEASPSGIVILPGAQDAP